MPSQTGTTRDGQRGGCKQPIPRVGPDGGKVFSFPTWIHVPARWCGSKQLSPQAPLQASNGWLPYGQGVSMMGEQHDFRALKAYAEKEFAFKQRKSFGLVPAGTEGQCAGVTMMWIKEKITATRNPFRSRDGDVFSHAGPTSVHEHNGATVLAAYNLGRGAMSGRQLDNLEGGLGLTSTSNDVLPVANYVAGTHTYDLAASLARVADALKPGTAACVQMNISQSGSGGHLVAMYKSRNSRLHFFDPNAGIYNILKMNDFFSSWVAVYHARNGVAAPKFNGSDQTSWCRFYPRH